MDPCPGCRTRDQRIRQLEAQARRDTDALNDAEENTRVWRRLAHRLILRCDELEEHQCAPTTSPPTTANESTA